MSEHHSTDRLIIPSGTKIDKYEIVDLIGIGGFGGIYKVKDVNTNKIYGMKTENYDSQEKMLKREIEIIKKLKDPCFPRYYDDGRNDEYQIIYCIINFLGASAGEVQAYHKYKLDVEITYNIALKMLENIEKFHELGYVHCDIKPSNFLIQTDEEHPFVLIDFGCSKKHIDPSTKKPFPCTVGKDFLGTRKYSSISVIQAHSCGRKDDLLSWFYSFLDLACYTLPFDGVKDDGKIIEIKKSLKLDQLDHRFPSEFQQIFDYLKSLNYEDCPDYNFIRKTFIQGMESDNYDAEKFDWKKFLDEHSNLDKFEKIVTLCTLNVINKKNHERKERMLENQKAEEEKMKNENCPQNTESNWHCSIE